MFKIETPVRFLTIGDTIFISDEKVVKIGYITPVEDNRGMLNEYRIIQWNINTDKENEIELSMYDKIAIKINASELSQSIKNY